MKRNLTCIICPRGCSLTAEGENDNLNVIGNTCPKGEKYAIDECTHPMRTVTSSVRVTNRKNTMVSVKTADTVPKEKIPYVMEKIRKTEITAPVKIGDIIIPDIFGTDIVATKNID